MQFVDTHIHVTYPDYEPDFVGMLARAKDAGVIAQVVPGLDLASSQQAVALNQKYKQIIPAVGSHPQTQAEDLLPYEPLAALPQVKAIGEIGTDVKAGDFATQEAKFRWFLELAIKVNKPALIHIRDTWDQTFAILSDYPELRGKFVIHCFTGGQKVAEEIARLGGLLSFTAIIARKSMEQTLSVIKSWPLDLTMLETDGPYLSWPGESWPNESITVPKIAELVAEIKGITVEEVAQKTTHTAKQFFAIDA